MMVSMFGQAFSQEVTQNDNLNITVTIKPLYNLVASIVKGRDNCKLNLLLDGNGSPHDYALKIKDLHLIETANLIVWGGDQLEVFLSKLLKQTRLNKKLLTIQELPNLKKLKFRNSSYLDEHWWLSPENAKVIILAIEKKLSYLDPANINLYAANRKKFLIQLGIVDSAIKEKLNYIKNKNYLVFHDAYQYFEKFYGLKPPIVISDNPSMPLSAHRIMIVRELMDRNKVDCIFQEPQFNSKALNSLINRSNLNSKLNIGILDPLGSDLDLGADGYFKLINKLSDSFYSCFK